MLTLSIPIFSFGIRVCERPISLIVPAFGFQQYATCIWWTVVTMTTIGYGDFYPRTLPGRILSFVLCIWGVIVMSLMVVALSTYTELERKQKVAHHRIEDISLKDEKKIKAVELIGSLYKMYRAYKSTKLFRKIRISNAKKKYKKNFLEFRYCLKQIRTHQLEADAANNFIIENDFLKFNFEEINQGQVELLASAKLILGKMKRLRDLKEQAEKNFIERNGEGGKRRSARVSYLEVFGSLNANKISKFAIKK